VNESTCHSPNYEFKRTVSVLLRLDSTALCGIFIFNNQRALLVDFNTTPIIHAAPNVRPVKQCLGRRLG
jgi:hypothetical protein